MNIELSLSLLDDVYEKLPSINIPQEVFDFINLMKSAKYSTFLNEEKEEIYHGLNLVTLVDLIKNFEKSCGASILLNSVVSKYITLIKTQPFEDDYV
ncbi:hypothetical protein [uncultured Flavobacterium sp.]|uniref:hypothetical protein n=1 Tax=uncultured Flavobacterium sp. TaxID=165435 RepID=UPI00259A7889|nr:hypothetical protein [uncultured Flavobacterium sp.]